MKLYGADKRELMTVSRVERSGNQLVIKAKVFGTMPLTAILTPAEVREGLKLLRARGIIDTRQGRGSQVAQLSAPDRPVTFTLRHPLMTIEGTAKTAGTKSVQVHLLAPDLGPLAAVGRPIQPEILTGPAEWFTGTERVANSLPRTSAKRVASAPSSTAGESKMSR